MGVFLSQQPNGKFCRFSTVVDTFTHWNMTEEEYIEYCIEKAREDAKWELKNQLSGFENVIENFIPNNNTVEEFKEILKEMGYNEEWEYDGEMIDDDDE